MQNLFIFLMDNEKEHWNQTNYIDSFYFFW